MSGESSRLKDYVEGRLSRAQLLKGAIATGLAVAAVPGLAAAQTTSTGGQPGALQFPYYPQVQGSYTPESVQEIAGNIITWATFEVTTSTFILSTPALVSTLGLTGLPLAFLQAFNVELQSQLDFWQALVPGTTARYTTFTIDPGLVPGPRQALAIFEVAASIRIGLMLAAVREFAELGQPTLAKYAAQTEGMYAEERAIARTLQALAGVSSAVPPNNKAFETDLFLYTRDAVAVLVTLGFVNGKGVSVAYPGRAAALAAGGAGGSAVIQRTPNNATTTVTVTGLGSFLAERT